MILGRSPLPPNWASETVPLARGGCSSILKSFLWASGGVVEVEMDSPLGALSIKTQLGLQSDF